VNAVPAALKTTKNRETHLKRFSLKVGEKGLAVFGIGSFIKGHLPELW
jgi:hypothetical protein